MREVFISYKSNDPELGNNDGSVAKELCEALEAAGISCWIAPRNIEPGKRYALAIMDALESCKAMVVVFSRFANESEHIANEVDKAFSRKIDIIPFDIDGSLPNRELDYYLRRMQWINASGSYRPRIPELITALRHKLGKTGQNVYRDAPSSIITAPVTQNIFIDAPTEQNTAPVTPNILNFTVNGVSFKMIRVKGGTFTMGATTGQRNGALDSEYPAHEVMLSTYYIGATQVTQKLWQAVMGSNPSRFIGDLNRPVECVSWLECQEFVKRLNEMTGRRFRLPTEAEWEFAARGGNKSGNYRYAGSDNLDDVAWYDVNSVNEPHPVATKIANELGLYDMLGNLWEWCQDWYDDYNSGSQTNPTGPNEGYYRVSRGGSWRNDPSFFRMSFRSGNNPAYKWDDRGFRLAL